MLRASLAFIAISLNFLLLWFLVKSVKAETYLLPEQERDSVIGDILIIGAKEQETLLDIARGYDVGHDEIIQANPKVNIWLPGKDKQIRIPSLYILPDAPRQGIVLNIAELRLYYFPKSTADQYGLVMTFPVSLGRINWKTPLGKTRIAKKEINPVWIPPETIKQEAAEEGSYLPEMIPGGSPDNPLGKFALRLGIPKYLIHGTDKKRSFGIGVYVTHGCIRMYPEDIETLFSLVKHGETVNIINQPVKVGWRSQELYIEIHRALDPEDRDESDEISLSQVAEMVGRHTDSLTSEGISALKRAYKKQDGVPMIIHTNQDESDSQ